MGGSNKRHLYLKRRYYGLCICERVLYFWFVGQLYHKREKGSCDSETLLK